MDAVPDGSASIRFSGPRTRPRRRAGSARSDRGGLDGLDDLGPFRARPDVSGSFDIDVDVLEPRLVVSASGGVVSLEIRLRAAADEVGHGLDELLVLAGCRAESGELLLGLSELGRQLSLLGHGDVARDDLFHGLLGPLEALALDRVDALVEPTRLGLALSRVISEIGEEA